MGLCTICNNAPIQNVKHQVCRCCRNRLEKDAVALANSNRMALTRSFRVHAENLEKRYPGITRDLQFLYDNPLLTLQQIAEKHGVTREYIRQEFKKVHGISYTEAHKQKRSELKHEVSSLGCSLHPLHKAAEYADGSNVKKGADIEKKVWKMCESMGCRMQIPETTAYDMSINGFLVDVKACFTARTYGKESRSYMRYARAGIRPIQRKLCDFIIAYVVELDRFYVLGREYFSGKSMLYFPVTKSRYTDQNPKKDMAKNLEPYREAWHLLVK